MEVTNKEHTESHIYQGEGYLAEGGVDFSSQEGIYLLVNVLLPISNLLCI